MSFIYFFFSGAIDTFVIWASKVKSCLELLADVRSWELQRSELCVVSGESWQQPSGDRLGSGNRLYLKYLYFQ